MTLKPFHKLLLSVLSGLLLSLPWLDLSSGMVLLIALVPLLIIEKSLNKAKSTYPNITVYAVLCFFIWNACSTWWLGNVTLVGALIVILINTAFYSFLFWLYCYSKRKLNLPYSGFILVVLWIGFEYYYLNAEFSWPWLNLGNGLCKLVKNIQWYEYTGSLGGTLWILLVNLFLTKTILDIFKNKRLNFGLQFFASLIALAFPAIVSQLMYYNYSEKGDSCKITIIQPNINPFTEKFGSVSASDQLSLILKEARKSENEKSDFYLGPETAIIGNNDLDSLNENKAVLKIRSWLEQHPHATFMIGAETSKVKKDGVKDSRRRFNSALVIDTSENIGIYHKSILVSGVEKMPYAKYFDFLEKFSFNLGGAFGTLDTDNQPLIFSNAAENFRITPAICYESAYGEFIAQSVKKGANLLFIITNDGWLGDSPGHKQHHNYSRMRAIETRRSIARCANTGISAFINQKGDVISSIPWNVRSSLTDEINANNCHTFYMEYGDYIGRIAKGLSILFLLYLVLVKFKFLTVSEKMNNLL